MIEGWKHLTDLIVVLNHIFSCDVYIMKLYYNVFNKNVMQKKNDTVCVVHRILCTYFVKLY